MNRSPSRPIGQVRTPDERTPRSALEFVLPDLASDDVIDVEQLLCPKPHHAPRGHNPTVDPTDRDLVDACEQWLAAVGAQAESIA